MTRIGMWLLAAAGTGKQSAGLRIPLPFEDAIRAALDVKPKAKRKRRRRKRTKT